MFAKILIANRGEIACRIIATARRLGIASVAVHSDADRNARHVRMADEAVHIGPPPAAESDLRGDRIIAAALESGAQAIHPGYGFLSENPDFAEAVERAGLVFIGPPAHAIRAMGLKDAAKRLMEKAGVPVVPGYHGEAQETVVLAGAASEIGYPVLIKARAGGGGKGMRIVASPQDFREALASARREAKAAFGDDRVLVEKLIARPRHIEVQIFGDRHGGMVHLFERDCSLQRRHQKIIEEAPAPGMDEAMRTAMTQAAVNAGKVIGYHNAGTVEFIADASEGLRPDRFWFMEMNTRIQVEHPVTELITGLDLVEWQLRIAAGERLPLRQDQIRLSGHAIEARLYAEDASRGFLPAAGELRHLRFPEGARVDAGVEEGDTVSPWYDPLIAKLIVHGETRDTALARLDQCLKRTEIAGTLSNVGFLVELARHEQFAAGLPDTGMVERELEQLTGSSPPAPAFRAVAALVALGLHAPVPPANTAQAIGRFALWEEMASYVDFEEGGEVWTARVLPAGENRWRVGLSTGEVNIGLRILPDGMLEAGTAGERYVLAAARWRGHVALMHDGITHEFRLARFDGPAHGGDVSGNVIAAPMPGLIKLLAVAAGETVRKGQTLLVLEAMKMEHNLTAHRGGVLRRFLVSEGMQVEEGARLAELDEGE